MQGLLHSSPFFRALSLCFAILCGTSALDAQSLYIGDNSVFYLGNGEVFTTGDNVVEVADNGSFNLEAGNSWGDAQEYVNGSLTALGSGSTKLPVGKNGVTLP